MSEARKIEAAASAAPQPESGGAPESPAGLFDRLRALFGLEPASVRDDIEDALDEAGGYDACASCQAIWEEWRGRGHTAYDSPPRVKRSGRRAKKASSSA